MKALVLHDSPTTQAKIAAELMSKGFQVVALGSQAAAREWLSQDVVDVLVMDECVGSTLTHTIALSAERRNPYVSVVMLTERTGDDAEELYLLIPCLYSLLGRETSPSMIARLAMASVVNVAETEERVRSRKLWYAALDPEDEAEDMRAARDIASDLEHRIEATNVAPPSGFRVAETPAPLSVRVPSFFSRSLGGAAPAGVAAPSLPDWSEDPAFSPPPIPERRLNLG